MTTKEPTTLIAPCGSSLVDLIVSPERAEELKALSALMPSIQITERAACDLELLATGAYSPLDRFMGEADYERVIGEMRLAGGHLFPIPITLPVSADHGLSLDTQGALRSAKNELLAVMTIEEIYGWDRRRAARQVFGTEDVRHPLVAEMGRWSREGRAAWAGSDLPALAAAMSAQQDSLDSLGVVNDLDRAVEVFREAKSAWHSFPSVMATSR